MLNINELTEISLMGVFLIVTEKFDKSTNVKILEWIKLN